MSAVQSDATITVTSQDHVATVEFSKPPHNYLNAALIVRLAEEFERLGDDPNCRAIVLAAGGKHFSAGADLPKRVAEGDSGNTVTVDRQHLFRHASRLLRTKKPSVAAVQGSAVGAGLGLALLCDFRVTCDEARFSANFNRQGLHPGFGMTELMPRLMGQQKANLMLYTGRRISGTEAVEWGLADVLAKQDDVRNAAQQLALEIAQSAPLSTLATRETLRRGLVEAFDVASEREFMEQAWLRQTEDLKEGIAAMGERRLPNFTGR